MDQNLYARKTRKISKKELRSKFEKIISFLDIRLQKNKPLLPKAENEEIQVYELSFPNVNTFHFDIARGLLRDAKLLGADIKTPGCGDSKTISVMLLCSICIEAVLNYVVRYCMHLMGYGEEEVYHFLRKLPIRYKISIIDRYFSADEDYKHGFQFLYNRIEEGIEEWAYVGYIRNRLIHHKGDIVNMSISQAKSVLKITEKIIDKFSSN